MQSVWRGAISFGLVSIPVRLYVAVEEKSMRFHHLHGADKGRIRYHRVCSVCGEDVPFDDIVKGYEYEKDRHVVFTEEDLQRSPVEAFRAIDIVNFVSLQEIDPIYFDRSYHAVPEPTGLKAYRLLEQTLNQSGRIAIAKVVLFRKERLAALRSRDGAFLMETMYWPDEIRAPQFDVLKRPVELRKQEVALAGNLTELLTERFDPTQFVDGTRQRLEELAQAKVEGEEVVVPATPPGQVRGLLEALQASVDAEKQKAGSKAKATRRR